MDLEIKEDKYLNRSDWVQCACREYMRIRQEMRKAETDSGPQGGGGQPVVNTPFKKFFPPLTSVIFCSDDC